MSVGRRGVAAAVWGFLSIAVLLALLAASASGASAAWRLAKGFGHEGIVLPPRLTGYAEQDVRQALVGPRGEIDLVMQAWRPCGDLCPSDLRMLRYSPTGRFVRSFGEPDRGLLLGSVSADAATDAVLDAEGGIVIGKASGEMASIYRFDRDGNFDRAFGTEGVATILCLCESLRLSIDGAGRILVGGVQEEGGRSAEWRPIRNAEDFEGRLLPNGAVDSSFGFGGVNAVRVDGLPESHALMPNGSTVYSWQGNTRWVHLSRWTASGFPDEAYEASTARSLESLPVPARLQPASVDAVVPCERGEIDVIGGTGSFGFRYVLRLRRNGSRDIRFGRGGIVIYESTGGSLLQVNGCRVLEKSSDREEQSVARLLLPSGRFARGFGGVKGVRLPQLVDANTRPVWIQGGHLLLFDSGGESCRRYCEPRPRLLELKRRTGARHRHRR